MANQPWNLILSKILSITVYLLLYFSRFVLLAPFFTQKFFFYLFFWIWNVRSKENEATNVCVSSENFAIDIYTIGYSFSWIRS